MPDGTREASDLLEGIDGDLELRLRATVREDELELDFAGSAPQYSGNLNCPIAVTRSACLFAVRVLTDPDIPPTAGAYRPVSVRAPEGTVLNARPGAAVAAGNVETSSRVADLVLAAFGRAQGQGTMNNLTLGDAAFSYYETLGGGQGACPDADGPSAVHVAMSNTLNTPIEALEREFPLRVIEYSLRRGSGGDGLHRGGDGLVREVAGARGDDLFADRGAQAPPPARRGGRRAGGRRTGPPRRQPAARQGDRGAARRPAAAHRNPRWGRIRRCQSSRLRGSGSWAWGSWARGWPRTSPTRDSRWRSGRTPPARPRRGRQSTPPTASRHPQRSPSAATS